MENNNKVSEDVFWQYFFYLQAIFLLQVIAIFKKMLCMELKVKSTAAELASKSDKQV